MRPDLRTIARALGGEVSGAQVLAPGPGHGPRDRSVCIKFSATAPGGFLVNSFAGDDFRKCRDQVAAKLGLPRSIVLRPASHARWRQPEARGQYNDDRANRIGAALALWTTSIEPRGTMVETYLTSRCLLLDDDVAGHVLRWNPNAHAMVALFRNIATDEPQAISRTYLDREGRKISRRFIGPVGAAAIKLDTDENVLGGLHIGEGVETCMAARQLGLKPTWGLGSKGAIGVSSSVRR